MNNFAVTFETLKSKPLNEKAIEKGIDLFKAGKVEFARYELEREYIVQVLDKTETRRVLIEFSRDGCDLESHYCMCNSGRNGIICKHIVAAVLAIQDGVAETKITVGKTASASCTVSGRNTARGAGSGSLDVFATPMMVALIEKAACEVLSDALEPGQTSVGTHISISHTAASPLGSKIAASAAITSVSGRKVEFNVTAKDESGEIGKGVHTRFIVDEVRFIEKAALRHQST